MVNKVFWWQNGQPSCWERPFDGPSLLFFGAGDSLVMGHHLFFVPGTAFWWAIIFFGGVNNFLVEEQLTKYIRNNHVINPNNLLILLNKLLTRAYGTESQLASQGGGLRPEVNIGPNKQINNMSWEHNWITDPNIQHNC